MSAKHFPQTVIEKFLLPNPQWQDGFRTFVRRLSSGAAWIYVLDGNGNHLIRLDRKGNRSSHASANPSQKDWDRFINDFSKKVIQSEKDFGPFPFFVTNAIGSRGIVFAIRHFGRLKALVFLCELTKPEYKVQPFAELFAHFVSSQVELAYKNFELNNFYETVHPRALALSTMHSVHRVISSSLRLQDLLPRIGRLSAQVLKAKGCAIMLVDGEHEFLIPSFAFGENTRFVHKHKLRIGRGLQGHVAATGEYHLTRNSIAVPLIEDDIVGVISLWDKLDQQPFTKIDMEILKSLSEHAVVAIKNAQLFEETEQLTSGSIQSINEILELNFGGDRKHIPVFRTIVMELGKELELSGRELLHLERAIMVLETGALAMPERVLKKEGKLTKKEYELIKRIPTRGATILSSISSLKPAIPIVLHHHERFDGKGYPEGLKGEEIPIGARIVNVVNSFLAMISHRSYRRAMTIEEGIQEIASNSGTQFDPRVVDCFLKVMRRKEIVDELRNIQHKAKKVAKVFGKVG